ncbi:hypothetical protein FZC78_19475 [Rossellomorea vietnamensis]|uniref:Uracil-DNA glycosylase-like domain-containing protein n=1 Tax=Rossellomorea vietnamensis TaxID=218284 RepID=A0A5D4NJ60_9BACI|nr:uracil-DNA glycosylase family protein [Rossellomorea vietnamensis]TYS14040.1 hypothetical protein FZC78_19475 [Rossellomorea vietnamensis]
MKSQLNSYLYALHSLSIPLGKEDLLTRNFLIEKTGDIEMYYAPHNEYINKEAKVVLAGITPGWTQMKAAYEEVLRGVEKKHSNDQILCDAKQAAGFSGTIRKNLTDMLDQCGLPETLGIESSLSLFQQYRPLLHTTSIIKYPVFISGKNYTGHHPAIDHSPLLSRYAYQEFAKELEHIGSKALVIPLGKTAEKVCRILLETENPPGHYFLFGFPHPSGANGHRLKQFHQNKEEMENIIKDWGSRVF